MKWDMNNQINEDNNNANNNDALMTAYLLKTVSTTTLVEVNQLKSECNTIWDNYTLVQCLCSELDWKGEPKK